MIKAASLELDVDLRVFSQYLWQQGIEHRINEESGQQIIWCSSESGAAATADLLTQWRSGDIALQQSTQSSDRQRTGTGTRVLHSALQNAIEAPVTIALIIVCILVAVVSQLGAAAYRVDALFYPPLPFDSLSSLLSGINSPMQFLRTLTPMFLHFGQLHIVFNMLWLWYFGKQLEKLQPGWLFLIVVIITSFASNTAQYLFSHSASFGGMSGVVYGLVGYSWIINVFIPGYRLMLNNRMFVVFVAALVLMEIFASSWIASAAHAGGLVSGLILGLLLVVITRLGGNRKPR